jgi:hypothetical protein
MISLPVGKSQGEVLQAKGFSFKARTPVNPGWPSSGGPSLAHHAMNTRTINPVIQSSRL